MLISVQLTGCAAALGAVMAANEIRRGLGGVQELVASARSVQTREVEIATRLASPIAGTYRGFQALGEDSIHFYIRTLEHPTSPIVDRNGNVTGYALMGIAAMSLDTLEQRVQTWTSSGRDRTGGRVLFFVEGTGAPEPNARTLYPAAFVGRIALGESPEADRHYAALLELDLDLQAPTAEELAGQGLSHELFDIVAEGIFTLRPGGEAVFRQEYEVADGRPMTLSFQRISSTTLPAVRNTLP